MMEATSTICNVCVVVNTEGAPVGVCPTVFDATAFARCLGFDAPIEAIRTVPVIEFARGEWVRHG